MDAAEQSGGNRRDRLRAQMRDEILAAARRIVRERGFEGLAMRALANAVGVTAPTLYDYFPSKEAVLNALYRQGAEFFQRAMTEATATAEPGLPRLWAAARAYRRFARTHPDLFQLLFGRVDRAYRPGEAEKGCILRTSEGLVARVAEAMALGHLRPADPEVVGRSLWITVHGFAMLEINGFCDPGTPALADAQFEATLAALFRGLRPAGAPEPPMPPDSSAAERPRSDLAIA